MKIIYNIGLTSLSLALLMLSKSAVAQNEGHVHHGNPTSPQNTGVQNEHGHHAVHEKSYTPVPPLSQADLAAAFPITDPHAMQHAARWNYFVHIDQLEAWDNAHSKGQQWQIEAWLGGDINRLWLHSDGQRVDEKLDNWSMDALYGRALSPWWDVVAGVRHDGNKQAPDLTRAVIGLQGLAPYEFDISVSAYLGGTGQAELVLEAEYSVLFTNRLILQPMLEIHWTAANDQPRHVGNGFNEMQIGARLRYEITRRLAPYIGFVHERHYGTTADWQSAAGESSRDSRWIAGIRVWF